MASVGSRINVEDVACRSLKPAFVVAKAQVELNLRDLNYLTKSPPTWSGEQFFGVSSAS